MASGVSEVGSAASFTLAVPSKPWRIFCMSPSRACISLSSARRALRPFSVVAGFPSSSSISNLRFWSWDALPRSSSNLASQASRVARVASSRVFAWLALTRSRARFITLMSSSKSRSTSGVFVSSAGLGFGFRWDGGVLYWSPSVARAASASMFGVSASGLMNSAISASVINGMDSGVCPASIRRCASLAPIRAPHIPATAPMMPPKTPPAKPPTPPANAPSVRLYSSRSPTSSWYPCIKASWPIAIGAANAPSTNPPRLAAAFTPAPMPPLPIATAPRAAPLATTPPAPKPTTLRGSNTKALPMFKAASNPPMWSANPPVLFRLGTFS